jgi:hypothetical protein
MANRARESTQIIERVGPCTPSSLVGIQANLAAKRIVLAPILGHSRGTALITQRAARGTRMSSKGLHLDRFMGYAHNASLFKRAAFEGVGGYLSKSLGLTLRSSRRSSGWCTRLSRTQETRS